MSKGAPVSMRRQFALTNSTLAAAFAETMPIYAAAILSALLLLARAAPAHAAGGSEHRAAEAIPPSPKELVPPAYAPPQDPMCGRLDNLLKKRLAKAERRKAVQTRRSLHCPANDPKKSRRPVRRKRRSRE